MAKKEKRCVGFKRCKSFSFLSRVREGIRARRRRLFFNIAFKTVLENVYTVCGTVGRLKMLKGISFFTLLSFFLSFVFFATLLTVAVKNKISQSSYTRGHLVFDKLSSARAEKRKEKNTFQFEWKTFFYRYLMRGRKYERNFLFFFSTLLSR